MTPKELLISAIEPAHAMLGVLGVFSDDRAAVLSLAIAGQESNWQYRVQQGGPARSFWQFEKGGVAGVLTHPSTRPKILAMCAELGVPCTRQDVYMAMADNDVLAACMARLLLYSDPRQLPPLGARLAAWDFYVENWRPGLPHPEFWVDRYDIARETVQKRRDDDGHDGETEA